LHRALETYRLPRRLVGTRTAIGEVPPRVKPIFRDRDELYAGTDLKTRVREVLGQSRHLIVVCSPDSARSAWVNQEITEFKKLHGESRVLAVIARGEPFASRQPGREAEECFPPALRSQVTASGFADGPGLEPIAADLRPHGDGRRRALLKLVSGMVGVGADDLLRRDAHRRIQQLALLAAASFAGMAAMAVLTLTAVRARNEAQIQRNEAHRQRGEAEELIEYMLGDLRKKLDPVGRLDVLDGIGEESLAYYTRQDPDHLDANSLGRRSRALHLIGELREQRGQLDLAQSAFQRAADTTARLLARSPNDALRIFDHAQSVYWVGHLAYLHGQMAAAEREFQDYISLADHLVRIDRTNLDWQAEAAYARGNVSVIFLNTARVSEALQILTQQRDIWQRLAAAKPACAFDLANTYGFMANAYEAQGDFSHAIEAQRKKIPALALVPNAEENQQVRRSLFTVTAEVSRLELMLGHADVAHQLAKEAVQRAQALVAVDPQNKTWLGQLYVAQVWLADAQLAIGDRAGAQANSQVVLAGSARLLAVDAKLANWQVRLRGLALELAARLATNDERPTLIDSFDDYLAKVRQFTTADRGLNQSRDLIVAQAELQLGVLLAAEGKTAEASVHWHAVVARVQPYAERGDLPAVTVLATAQVRLGAVAAARALAQRIESTPYRHPSYAALVEILAGGVGPLVTQTKRN
jgi:tetratricopeptide (TPR) repeat protein